MLITKLYQEHQIIEYVKKMTISSALPKLPPWNNFRIRFFEPVLDTLK